jgi:hypothetical protein
MGEAMSLHAPLQEKRYLKAAKAVHRVVATTNPREVPKKWADLEQDDLATVQQIGRAIIDLWDAMTMGGDF